MSAALDFQGRTRRLELTLDAEGRARGRWRRQAVSLEESGRFRVSLLDELGPEEAEDGLPPPVPTAIPELSLRSAAPSRLLLILDRPEIRADVTGLFLAAVRSVEVREAEVIFQLGEAQDLTALKHTLDGAVELVQRILRELERTPVAPSPAPVELEREGLSPERLDARLKRNRETRRRARRFVATLAAFVGVTALLFTSGHISGALGLVFICLMPLIFLAMRVTDRGTPACPACGAYLSLFFVYRRCPRCDLFME